MSHTIRIGCYYLRVAAGFGLIVGMPVDTFVIASVPIVSDDDR